MRNFILQVTVLIGVFCKISPEDIKDVLDSIKTNKPKVLRCSIVNPIFGYVFESVGALNNIRFYGLEIKISKKENLRNFSLDSSDNDIVALAIELFPSPTGVICPIRNMKDNFGNLFKRNKYEGIEFMSEMFLRILGIEPDFTIDKAEFSKVRNLIIGNRNNRLRTGVNTGTNTGRNTGTNTGRYTDLNIGTFNGINNVTNTDIFNVTNADIFNGINTPVFNEIGNVTNTRANIHGFNEANTIKLLLIQSFMINILDTKNDLKHFICIIHAYLNENNLDTILKFDLTGEILKIRQNYLAFPFSEINQPPSNSVIPIYDRKKDIFDEKIKFADCADILILNICNCLFYNPKTYRYSTDTIDPESDLAKFYEKHSEIFTITDEIRNDWSRVVQGLEDFPIQENSKFNTHKIVYLKEKRNELDTGIINMMNVLIKICDLDHKKFWEEVNRKGLFESIEDLLRSVSTSNLNLTVVGHETQEFIMRKRVEIMGTFYLNFSNNQGMNFTLKVYHTDFHSGSEITKFQSSMVDYIVPETSDKFNVLSLIFKNYAKMNSDIPLIENKNVFDWIYLTKPIRSECQKRIVLAFILDTIARECLDLVPVHWNFSSRLSISTMASRGNSPIHEILKGITNSIISTLNLNDFGTRKFFMPCLVYCDVKESEVIECWEKSLKIPNLRVYKLWERRVLESEEVHATINISGIPLDRISMLFDNLSRLRLRSLALERIDLLSVNKVSKELSKLNQLESLDLSTNNLNSDGTRNFIKTIGNLTRLVILNLSNSVIDIENSIELSKALINLPNLKKLDLSGCRIDSVGIKFISSSFHFIPKLESLNLSINELSAESTMYLCLNLEHLPNLKEMKLSRNKIGQQGVFFILSKIKELMNLEECDLSMN